MLEPVTPANHSVTRTRWKVEDLNWCGLLMRPLHKSRVCCQLTITILNKTRPQLSKAISTPLCCTCCEILEQVAGFRYHVTHQQSIIFPEIPDLLPFAIPPNVLCARFEML